jgi:integrase/recombinase XerC
MHSRRSRILTIFTAFSIFIGAVCPPRPECRPCSWVASDGERITRGTLQYRVLRAFRKAGLDGQRARGALVHGPRHTYATELANADVSVYTLMKLLGHESMTTSQRYVSGAGTENRAAAAQNPLYELIEQPTSNN